MTEETPKIIIDEDWKAQVQREKEEAARKSAGTDEKPQAGPGAPAASQGASFEALASGLSMQAMLALGMVAPRDAKEVTIDLIEGKYLIDMLMVLRDKTKGNLTPQEQGLLTQTIADLQQVFVVRTQQMQEAALRGERPGPNVVQP